MSTFQKRSSEQRPLTTQGRSRGRARGEHHTDFVPAEAGARDGASENNRLSTPAPSPFQLQSIRPDSWDGLGVRKVGTGHTQPGLSRRQSELPGQASCRAASLVPHESCPACQRSDPGGTGASGLAVNRHLGQGRRDKGRQNASPQKVAI